MAVNTIDPTKPILGYSLKQRIGIGGFGEVWAAEAPGGLPKAVKFIFGYHDEKRAQAELKALNRIRDVRHPFLLSLERIDIVDGQMVVITELADMCLKTRFDACVQSGLNGIPRAELLGYLADAAGALDYIREEFRLQHLDVKPENLLLVSGHVKVADFGLVKDIHDGTQSMMSGLTPAYAPPELFDGRPSTYSDQYSLAVLYQEMLTGQRPFNGATAAQLASQHINDRPSLKPLPRDDQAIVSRALSKDPELRHPSCASFIEQLTVGRSQQTAGSKPRTRQKLRDRRARRRSSGSPSSTMSLDATREHGLSPTEVTRLEPVDYVVKQAKFRPTLLIGIGRTGTQALVNVRAKLRERVGDLSDLPALRCLAIDTDPHDLRANHGGDPADELSESELLAMPLRRPEEYRVDAKMHLSWLSRRWIYNVPKSLRTEGIRPLGRLALATHVDELSVRLRQVISELVQAEQVARTAASLDLDPSQQPQVILVGAIGGGTCSGMALDVAYLARAVLREIGVLDEDVIGVFTHSATGMGKQRELVIANALVFLNELYHFSCVEEYPGDATCSIPPSTDGTTTFASTYLVDLGSDLNAEQYRDQIDSLAEYLYLGVATPCGSYLDLCRHQETETVGLPLRSFDLCRSVGSRRNVSATNARRLGDHVLDAWTNDRECKGMDIPSIANELLSQAAAKTDQMVKLVHEAIHQVLGDDSVHQLARAIAEAFDPNDREASHGKMVEHVINVFGEFDGVSGEARDVTLLAAVQSIEKHYVEGRLPVLLSAVMDIVDVPGKRLAGAIAVHREISQRLEDQVAQLGCMMDRATETIQGMANEFLQSQRLTEQQIPEFANGLAEVLLQRFSLKCVKTLTETLLPFAASTKKELSDLKDHLASAFLDRPDGNELESRVAGDPSDHFVKQVQERLAGRLGKLRHRVEQQLQHNFLDHHGGFRAVLEDAQLRRLPLSHFEDAANATIAEQLKEIDLEDCFANSNLEPDEFASWVVNESTPHLIDCGGSVRLLCATPRRSKPLDVIVDAIAGHCEQRANVIPSTLGELVCCMEAENIPLDNIAMHLIHGRPDSLELATRLHSRTDISWTHISSMR